MKEVKTSANISFDWRNTDYCHCTIKAISLYDSIPDKAILDNWITETQKILSTQKPFSVIIQDIDNFSTTIFAHVQSEKLLTLHKRLFKVLPSSQPQFENNNYVPHVSLDLFNKEIEHNINLSQYFGKFMVDEIQFIIWNLNNLTKPIISHNFHLTS